MALRSCHLKYREYHILYNLLEGIDIALTRQVDPDVEDLGVVCLGLVHGEVDAPLQPPQLRHVPGRPPDGALHEVVPVDGRAIGGGAEIALWTDFRSFAPAGQLMFVEARMGLATGFSGAVFAQFPERRGNL